MLMSLPGTPIVYYGDEIGMGDNVNLGDRNGVRTPMQWDGGWNGGVLSAPPGTLFFPLMLYPGYGVQAGKVQSPKKVDHSLLFWRKRIIPVRQSLARIRKGGIGFFDPANHRVLAYVRQYGKDAILVVNNLSSSAQAVELDLRRYKGNILIEMFGRNIFPRIGDLPYLLTMGPYQFYWFRLRKI